MDSNGVFLNLDVRETGSERLQRHTYENGMGQKPQSRSRPALPTWCKMKIQELM